MNENNFDQYTFLARKYGPFNNMLKMQKQTKFNFTPIHLALLSQLQDLFSRPNLCSNNYLYKQMTANFQIPLSIIFAERKIAQITNNQQIIKEALEMCNVVQVVNDQWMRVLQFPTLKFSSKYRQLVKELALNLKIQNRNVLVFQKRQDNQIHLSLIQPKSISQLEKIAANFNTNWEFKIADLKVDLKTGISRIRKLKQQNKRNFKNQKYSLDRPPGIFIRKAVETSDQEQDNQKKIELQFKKQQEKEKDKEKKSREKPIINEDEFPCLS